MLMTLALVAPLLDCVGSGTALVGLDQATYGYNVNASKTWLVTKSSFQSPIAAQFAGTGVRVTCEGRPYLGAAIGSQEYSKKFIDDKVREWSVEVLLLAKIGESQPHAAYSALTHGLSSRWHCVPYRPQYRSVFTTFGRCNLLHSSSSCVRNFST